MYPIPILQERIREAVETLAIPDTPPTLYEPIRYILDMGGKRIRPLMTLLAADLFGDVEEACQRAMPAALAVELFHNSTLMHDDILDGAPLRRGKPAVHEKWSVDTAILSGDTTLLVAYSQLAKSDPARLPTLLNVFNRVTLEVCEGQQLDMDYEKRARVTIDEYVEMIRMKTSVLLGGAAELGAIAVGASDADVRHIGDFGMYVGIAFQLQDDILDVFGDPNAVGKQVGGDILANKKTYLLIKALELAQGADKALLNSLLATQDMDSQEKVRQVTEVYERLNVLREAQRAMNAFSVRAFEALDRVSVAEERKAPLRALARELLVRQH